MTHLRSNEFRSVRVIGFNQVSLALVVLLLLEGFFMTLYQIKDFLLTILVVNINQFLIVGGNIIN